MTRRRMARERLRLWAQAGRILGWAIAGPGGALYSRSGVFTYDRAEARRFESYHEARLLLAHIRGSTLGRLRVRPAPPPPEGSRSTALNR